MEQLKLMSAHILSQMGEVFSQIRRVDQHILGLAADLRKDIQDVKGDVRVICERTYIHNARIAKLEQVARKLEQMARPRPKAWAVRDYVLASAGGSLVVAASLEKIPWSTVSAFLSAIK